MVSLGYTIGSNESMLRKGIDMLVLRAEDVSYLEKNAPDIFNYIKSDIADVKEVLFMLFERINYYTVSDGDGDYELSEEGKRYDEIYHNILDNN